MNDTEQLLESAGESVEYARQYLEHRMDLIRLEAAERMARSAAALVTNLVLAGVIMFVVFLVTIAIGFWLSDSLGSPTLSFLILAGFYLLIGMIMYLKKDQWITKTVIDMILMAFFSEEPDPTE